MHLQVPGRPNDRPGLSLGPLRPASIRVPEGVETEAAIVDLKDQPLGPSQEFLDSRWLYWDEILPSYIGIIS